MSVQARAFLSHSSKDKGIVSSIYKHLTAAHVHYDEGTFEKGETSAAELFRALCNTDVFVLFLSKNSVNSPWVQTEIALGQQKIYGGKVKKILVFVLDDLDLDLVPEWIKVHVYHKTASPGVIATSIRSALFEVAVAQSSAVSLFMGRDKELGQIKEALSALTKNAPVALFLAGNEGIGRRTLAKRALRDVHPQLINFPIEITLSDKDGEIEFYRSLLNQGEHLTVLKEIEKIEAFNAGTVGERADAITQLIERISDQRQIVFLRGKDAIIKDDGFFPEWLALALTKLKPSPWPKIAIVARRMISPSKRSAYEGVAFFPVNSLEANDSKKLLSIWLKHLGTDLDPSIIDEIVEYVSGHPRNIQIAATLAAEFGSARLQTSRVEFLETIRQQARALIDGLKVDGERERLLALFREYEYLSPEDLFVALGVVDETALAKTIGYLNEHGIIENDGSYLRLAPYLLDALSRYSWSDDARRFVTECRDRILSRVAQISTDDYIDISTIDSGILSALRQSKPVENVLLARCLLPSHLLRVAREFYDRTEYSRTVELAQKAFAGRGKLSVEAQVEALRLKCLACVRLGKDDDLHDSLQELERYGEQLAKRTVAFIKGFKARYDGKLDYAETQYRLAYQLGGQRNFHILRELAQLSKLKEEYKEAEEFARTALEIADRNPFIIDTLLEIIIERHKDDEKFLRDDSEVSRLFIALEETARREKRSFYESRQAHFHACLHNTDEAIRWAEKAVETTPNHVPVQLTLAKIQLDLGETEKAKKTLDKVTKLVRNAGTNADRRNVGDLDKLQILLAIQGSNFNGARQVLQRAMSLPKSLRETLGKKIDVAEAYYSKHQ